ncbi:uncharacterized protein LOC127254558 isoform X2 [Andrographis paniculata]|uniref:uncharacterized protein LOC127254558 isoform X2 n=1 Tax=Andrographis paniculata TaxID=175694 RepID=UPI0021E8CF8E|nr:uncharacterized protein LOC127254558 isoform X2 [Andrographis paniculata]
MEAAAGMGLTEGGVGEKRRQYDSKDASAQPKRFKGGSVVTDLKNVAGIVLVMAAMGKMRGGKTPTEAEKEMMKEARNGLVKVCESFKPEEVFRKDAFGGVVENLGLNRVKAQRIGFQPSAMSIAQKLLDSKKKMEQAADLVLPLTLPLSQCCRGSSGASLHFQASKIGSSAALKYQLPSSEIKPVASCAFQSNNSVSVALSQSEKPNLRSDGQSKGSTHVSQAQGTAQSDIKVVEIMSHQVWGSTATHGLTTQEKFGAIIAQTGTIQPSEVANNAQASMETTHSEIGSIVKQLLQPLASGRRTWFPLSREYINKALTCQICTATVTEIDTILICDACEKGYHLKCLQATNQKVITRGEWHCAKCLSLSNGKPFPIKYGLVLRNANTSSSSNSSAVPSAPTKQVINISDAKVGQPRVTEHGKSRRQNVPTNAAVDKDIFLTEADKADDGMVSNLPNAQDGTSLILYGESNTVKRFLENCSSPADSKESPGDKSSNHTSTVLKEKNLTNSGSLDQDRSSDCLHSIKWVGEPVQVLDKKIYYTACSINGHVYRVTSHVVIHLDNGKPTPSRLRAMWEDTCTSKKWVSVNRCYFPGEMPEGVCHPCSLSSSEVYESAQSITLLMDGLIESPCKVLPAGEFDEETEKRKDLNGCFASIPMYLCRWIYDETKGLFRDISC